MHAALELRRREDEIRDVAETLRQSQCMQGGARAPSLCHLHSHGPDPQEASQSGSLLMEALRPAPGHRAR